MYVPTSIGMTRNERRFYTYRSTQFSKNNTLMLFLILVISLRITLTVPMTSATAERSFSKLKTIKSYLRNTISQKRLTELATIEIENETANTLEFKNAIELFASKKSRKQY